MRERELKQAVGDGVEAEGESLPMRERELKLGVMCEEASRQLVAPHAGA